jgi:predicted transcriptional regulator
MDKSHEKEATGWTFLTNHAHVLILLAQNPERVLREVATAVGITERAVQRIVSELEHEGYIQRSKEGRKNNYTLNLKRPFRHPIESHVSIGELVQLVLRPASGAGATAHDVRPPGTASDHSEMTAQ